LTTYEDSQEAGYRDPEVAKQRGEAWNQARRSFDQDFNRVKKQLEAQFRSLIGIQ
jgi:hypothetical protein